MKQKIYVDTCIKAQLTWQTHYASLLAPFTEDYHNNVRFDIRESTLYFNTNTDMCRIFLKIKLYRSNPSIRILPMYSTTNSFKWANNQYYRQWICITGANMTQLHIALSTFINGRTNKCTFFPVFIKYNLCTRESMIGVVILLHKSKLYLIRA